jgi:hypothetical protein
MDASGIRGITVGYESNFLFWFRSADGFPHSDNGRLLTPVISDMVGCDLMVLRRDKKENIVVLTGNFDIGFIASAYVINIAFVLKIEGMAVISGGG